MDKVNARLAAKTAVSSLNLKDRFAFSAAITDNLFGYIADTDIKSAFVYMSVSGEPSTTQLILELLRQGVKVYIPKTVGDDMLVTEITAETSFSLNKYGIPEAPICGQEYYAADINIIPLVAFDKNRNRCGHGKGYYDKYLAKATGKTVALAFSAQEVDKIETDDHDIKPSAIITEKGIIK